MDLNFNVCEHAYEKRRSGNVATNCDTVMSNFSNITQSLKCHCYSKCEACFIMSVIGLLNLDFATTAFQKVAKTM